MPPPRNRQVSSILEFFVDAPTAGGAEKLIVLRASANATVKAVTAQLAAKCGAAAKQAVRDALKNRSK